MWLHTSFVKQLRCAIRSGHGPFTCWNKHWRQGRFGVIHKGERRNRETYLQRAIWNKTRATYHLPVLQKSASHNSYYIIWNRTCELLSILLCYNINKVPLLPCGPFAITASASMKFPHWALTPAVWKSCHSLKPGEKWGCKKRNSCNISAGPWRAVEGKTEYEFRGLDNFAALPLVSS